MRFLFAAAWFAGQSACTFSPTAAPPAAEADLPGPGARSVVAAPTTLLDYLPPNLGGRTAENLGERPEGAQASYPASGSSVQVEIGRISDVAATRASFELLGLEVASRTATTELRGARVQGNPAQLTRQLDPPHRATLHVVAANTYLVTVTVEPSSKLDTPLAWADRLDIGGLTRLAIVEHKARAAAPPPVPSPTPAPP